MKPPIEPFRIKVVESVQMTEREEREQLIRDAAFNLFKIPAEKIFIDLLTDSGTSAMSDTQWAGLMRGDESYAGCRNYFHLQETVQEIMGYEFCLPTHQGRAAENILFTTLIKKGDRIPSNNHFDTTRANIEYLGAKAIDCVIDEAYNPEIELDFKGDMDEHKLRHLLKDQGKERVPLVCLTITNNSGGGQPVSLENIRMISEVCKEYEIPFFLDAARFAENAYFIKIRDKNRSDKSIKQIVREIFSYADGCWVSAKKDALVNIGGFIALKNRELFEKLQNILILREGFPTYGGLAGRDLEAVAVGLQEVLNEDYLEYRIKHTAYLGHLLITENIPIVKPVGGHAVYVDAKRFLPHIPQHQFPAQALTVSLFREAGVRAVEIGSLMFASKDPATNEWRFPALELVRMAIPRRVYTSSHLQYVAEAVVSIKEIGDSLRGLKLIYEPPFLRHFTATLEEIS